jgi:hypothetical protein
VELPKGGKPEYKPLPAIREENKGVEEIEKAANAIDAQNATIAVWLAEGHEAWAKSLENSKEISSVFGQVVVGNLGNKRIIAFVHNSLDGISPPKYPRIYYFSGFSVEKSVFFAQVLQKLNIHILLHTFTMGILS